MQTQKIGQTNLTASRLIYGVMAAAHGGLPNTVTDEQMALGRASILAAYDAGYTHFDSADIYARGVTETVLGQVLKQNPAMRDNVVITTKCGIRFADDPAPGAPQRYDFSRKHITWSCEQSLKRLGIDTIDIYILHRPDVLMNPPEVAAAFDELTKAGKIRFPGVSNFKPSQLAALNAHLPTPPAVNQVRCHLGWLDPFHDGTLDQCLELGISPQAYSPVGKGMFATGGQIKPDAPNRERLEAIVNLLDDLAAAHNTTRTAINLSWLLMHPAGILPIMGTTKPDRIREAPAAFDVTLTREEWYKLYVTARGSNLP